MKSILSIGIITFLCLAFKPATVDDTALLWMRYPAISPDGKQIVFCYKGDIFKVDANGGTALQLTSSDAHDFNPVWSNDGKWIAFASDRYGNYDVFLVSAEGGSSKRLTCNSAGDIPNCFSPDGKEVFFTSSRVDDVNCYYSPVSRLPELYKVSVEGGREKMVFSHPAEELKINATGDKYYFIDKKGYEDAWRKHHTSSVTRDIWVYDKTPGTYKKLSEFNGEDRSPCCTSDEKEIYYLSEKSGSFNAWKMKTNDPASAEQLTGFEKNPVRFLSISQNNMMCYTFDGEIYTQTGKEKPNKIKIKIVSDERFTPEKNESFTTGVSEMNISSTGKEVVFIVHGDVFVTSMEGAITRQITNTPGLERSVSFSPDGKSVLYASERNKIWGIYQTSLTRAGENQFFNSTLLKEEPLVVTTKESFQPKYSPDGTEVAYLEDRTALKIYNIKTKETRLILPKEKEYSYSDGDQWFDWSPDGKYLLLQFLEDNQWMTQAGLVESNGKGVVKNMTRSGYDAGNPKWMMNGKMMIWNSSRNGMKSHGSWGAQSDEYAIFFTKEAFDRFKMSKEEFALVKEKEDKDKEKEKDKEKHIEITKHIKGETHEKSSELPEVKIDFNNLEDRKVRLTAHSSDLGDAVVTKDGEQMYYLAKFEKGYDLWLQKFREHETKLFMKLNAENAGNIIMDKDSKTLFFIADGSMIKVNIDKNDKQTISFKADMVVNPAKEREEMFEHAWRQAKEKFYATDMQKTDWNYYKAIYSKFLPHINNNKDFAEMMSELLGELNASHTGCFSFAQSKNPDVTAALGFFYDENFPGKGLKIAEVIAKGPFDNSSSQIKANCIVEKIDDQVIEENTNYFKYLNRKAGKNTLISFYDPATQKRWDEVIKPITQGEQQELLYERWVKIMQAETDRLSKGKLGYVHVRGMDDESFREIFDQSLGIYANKKGLIVDTRYNGGGWLHDDLCTFLSGKDYVNFVPRERKIGHDPQRKWVGPSIVLMSEGNYSDAHMFPYAYRALKIGKLVGMPVAGTGTAVWWETLLDKSLVFGIPEVGVVGMDGKYLENQQLEPDIKIENDFNNVKAKRDLQLEKAVEELMK